MSSAFAELYYWTPPSEAGVLQYPTAHGACNRFANYWEEAAVFHGDGRVYNVSIIGLEPFTQTSYVCKLKLVSTYPRGGGETVYPKGYVSLNGDSCFLGKRLNPRAGECGAPAGKPEGKVCAGNPIDLTTGNKFQMEVDFPSSGSSLEFSRSYNGVDGIWRHTYSSYIRKSLSHLSVIGAQGEEHGFGLAHIVATPEPTVLGKVTRQQNSWTYTSKNNESYVYDLDDRLIKVVHANGNYENLAYSGGVATVTDNRGKSFTFTQDALHQPLTLDAPGLSIQYQYNEAKILTQISRTHGTQVETRLYHYEDPRDLKLLTGITDEKGVRFATWSYDDQGRAISSEHANGAEHTQVTYNEDGTSTVTNALGKKTVYHFTDVGGFKKIASIEGEPSANCPASNSTFTYNDRGQVLTQTDAKGFVTTYTYNDRGLETTRTEASGTPKARNTTTTWHATFNLPLTVTEGGQVTTYTYDTEGRQTSHTQNAL
ncbi:MAG: DUF6531 domain-containing protein [Pseudomonas sp.]